MDTPLTEDSVKNYRVSSMTLGFLMTVIIIVATIVWSVSSYSNKINRVSDKVETLITNSVTQAEFELLQIRIDSLNAKVVAMDEEIQDHCDEEE